MPTDLRCRYKRALTFTRTRIDIQFYHSIRIIFRPVAASQLRKAHPSPKYGDYSSLAIHHALTSDVYTRPDISIDGKGSNIFIVELVEQPVLGILLQITQQTLCPLV